MFFNPSEPFDKCGSFLLFVTTNFCLKKIYSFHKKCKTPENRCAIELRKYTHILSTDCEYLGLNFLKYIRYFRPP